MKLERLEVRLRPKNPAEQELIEALEAQDGIYGGKTRIQLYNKMTAFIQENL